jgi:MFS family permease
VVGGSVLLTLQNGLIISAFGAYLVVITADTGWSPGVIALGYAIVQLGNGFLSPLTGWFCDRVGVRAVARAGTVVTASGFGVAATVTDATHFIGAVVVIALGCSAAGITPLTVAVVQTMTDRRTLALGLLPTGIALGGLAVPEPAGAPRSPASPWRSWRWASRRARPSPPIGDRARWACPRRPVARTTTIWGAPCGRRRSGCSSWGTARRWSRSAP